MAKRNRWSREQLLIAFWLYAQLPFGQLHSRNPEIVKYAKLIDRTPSALAMKLSNLASLDPEITSSGRSGLKGASSADRKMWSEMQSDWTAFAAEIENALRVIGGAPEPETIGEPDTVDFSGETRETIVQARVGQGFFRNAVLSAYNYKCCISGLAVPKLLVASHIVPWSIDEKNRLNPMNGLCLSAIHDKAFDAGIITIDTELKVQVSKKFQLGADTFFKTAILAFHEKPIAAPTKFCPHLDFLAYHRESVFVQ